MITLSVRHRYKCPVCTKQSQGRRYSFMRDRLQVNTGSNCLWSKRRNRGVTGIARPLKIDFTKLRAQDDTTFDLQVNLVMLGQVAGKTSLMRRYTQGEAPSGKNDATVGIDYRVKDIELADRVIRLQIWDTPSNENFRPSIMINTVFRCMHGILVVYDVTDRSTFDWVQRYVELIKSSKDAGDTPVMLVGNHCDEEKARVITKEEGEQMAEMYGMLFVETSAKTCHNVPHAFGSIAHAALNHLEATSLDNEPEETQQWICCSETLKRTVGFFSRRGGSNVRALAARRAYKPIISQTLP